MQCKKCGANLLETDRFCKSCGEPVSNVNPQNNQFYQQSNIQQPINNGVGNNNGTMNNTVPKKKNPVAIILMVIGGIVVGIVIIFVIIFSVVSKTSDKLVCKSDEGNITIMYNENGITGYTARGLSYDMDEQKEYAKKIGMDAYITEFNTWFSTNTSGSCTIDGKKVKSESTTNTDNTTTNKSVGDSNYGYVDVPKNWGKFYDVSGSDTLQYSYSTTYIITLDYMDDNQYTAKDYASNFMYNMQNDSSVTDVTGATVTIGKNKEYTAYQVYMYYPADAVYLVTYWFEAEDGKTHYIALEGPSDVVNYTYIPESFRLTK